MEMQSSMFDVRLITCNLRLLQCFSCDQYSAVQVERTPWCDDIMSAETNMLLSELIDANRHGFLTINSQPRVNAAPSTDPVVGWGNPGGYIFQKVLNLTQMCNEKYTRSSATVKSTVRAWCLVGVLYGISLEIFC